jgi:RNA polymerase sigma factor (TIGR02999 family)
MSDVTHILHAIEQGDSHAVDRLLPVVYDELRKLAAQKMAQEKAGQTLEATALVHEVYLRLVDHAHQPKFANRRHFFAAAAEAMRRILIEQARHKQRIRHGGDREKVALRGDLIAINGPNDDVLAIHEALDQLAERDGQTAELVKLHYFAGLTLEEAGEMLEISPRTAYRDWAFARAWLYRQLGGDDSRK